MKQTLFIKIFIVPNLMISPLLTMSCNSWFSIWLSIEFNLMMFIPFIILFNKKNNIISIKYFIIQAISSAILLLSSNLILINLNYNYNLINLISIFINLSIFIKLGSAPFHNWFLVMMNKMNWLSCLILSTWQKLIPFISLMYVMNFYMLILSILISSFIGCVIGLNQKSLRLIMGYSSINHLSWMILNLMFSEWLWMIYFISYSISSMSIMLIFKNFNFFYLNNLYFMNNNYSYKILIFMNLISLNGFPPTFGFLIKWMSIYNILMENIKFLILLMMMLSIISFMYYLQISISCIMMYNMSYKLSLKSFKFFYKNQISIYLIILLSFFSNFWIISFWIF